MLDTISRLSEMGNITIFKKCFEEKKLNFNDLSPKIKRKGKFIAFETLFVWGEILLWVEGKMAKKGYGYFYFLDENNTLQMRKLTGRKRKEVLKNYLRRRSDREMKVETMANAFNVSIRSMQKFLKELEQENVIRREVVYDENGRQKSNRIVYIGDKPRLTGKEMQLEKVCAADNPLKLRDFRWEGYWRLDAGDIFFNYERVFGCDGMIPELNARARRNGCASVYENPEEFKKSE